MYIVFEVVYLTVLLEQTKPIMTIDRAPYLCIDACIFSSSSEMVLSAASMSAVLMQCVPKALQLKQRHRHRDTDGDEEGTVALCHCFLCDCLAFSPMYFSLSLSLYLSLPLALLSASDWKRIFSTRESRARRQQTALDTCPPKTIRIASAR